MRTTLKIIAVFTLTVALTGCGTSLFGGKGGSVEVSRDAASQ